MNLEKVSHLMTVRRSFYHTEVVQWTESQEEVSSQVDQEADLLGGSRKEWQNMAMDMNTQVEEMFNPLLEVGAQEESTQVEGMVISLLELGGKGGGLQLEEVVNPSLGVEAPEESTRIERMVSSLLELGGKGWGRQLD